MSEELPIVLYHYAYSPFARRVVWYLHMRGIPYTQCVSARGGGTVKRCGNHNGNTANDVNSSSRQSCHDPT